MDLVIKSGTKQTGFEQKESFQRDHDYEKYGGLILAAVGDSIEIFCNWRQTVPDKLEAKEEVCDAL